MAKTSEKAATKAKAKPATKAKAKTATKAKMMTKPKAPSKAPSTGMETMDVTVWTVNRPEQDQAREDRIEFEAIVDANGPEEQATGWYYYLQDKMTVPFTAICINERDISPLQTLSFTHKKCRN